MLLSDKHYYYLKQHYTEQRKTFYNDKRIHQEAIIITNIYAPNIRAPEYMQQKGRKQKGRKGGRKERRKKETLLQIL